MIKILYDEEYNKLDAVSLKIMKQFSSIFGFIDTDTNEIFLLKNRFGEKGIVSNDQLLEYIKKSINK